MAAVAIPVALLFGFVEWKLHRMPDFVQRKHQAWLNQHLTTEILVLGSSHAQFGIRPDVFGYSTFNLAGFSQTLRYDSALFARVIPQSPQLKALILSLSYFSLQEELAEGSENWRCWSYLDAWSIAPPSTLKRFDPKRWSRIIRMGNWRALTLALRGFPDRPDLVNLGLDGWGEPVQPIPVRIQDSSWARERMEQWRESMDAKRKPSQQQLLESILRIASSHNLKVVLVRTPVSKPLRDLENPEETRWIGSLADSLAKRYGARWLDLESDPEFELSDFVDMDHLNVSGATKLSKKISESMPLLHP